MTVSEECLRELPYGKFVRFENNVLVWRTKDVYGKKDVYEYFDPETGKYLGLAKTP